MLAALKSWWWDTVVGVVAPAVRELRMGKPALRELGEPAQRSMGKPAVRRMGPPA